MFGGGLSLAEGINQSGLGAWIGSQAQLLGQAPLITLIIAVTLLVIFLTEILSNPAATALMIPIVAAAAISIGQNPLLLVIPTVIAASCAFMLPVVTPPNAVVYGTGYVTITQMVKSGMILNFMGVIVVTLLT